MAAPRFPGTLPEFQRAFPDEAACVRFIEQLRWPEGFVCPRCSVAGTPYRFRNRATVLRCRSCRRETRLLAGTVMQDTRTPLQVWFWAAYLVTSHTPGLSALQFQRQLGMKRYETAFQLLHKLRAAMVRPERDRIGSDGYVEVDETYIGGRTRGEGRGVTYQALVAGAVEVREPKDSRSDSKSRPFAGRLRLAAVADRSRIVLEGFVRRNVTPASVVATDGWVAYEDLSSLGYRHRATVVAGDKKKVQEALPVIHRVFANLKTWIDGTHHGVGKQHLSAYLNEFVFRFNRRFYPMTAFNSVLGIALRRSGPTYKGLYGGDWEHPGDELEAG